MAYLRDRAIVLKNEPFREHDRWLTLYGVTHGKMIAVARGARRLDAKHLGHLEPFTEVEVMIARGQAFDKLAVATTVQTRLGLRRHLGSLVIGGAIASLVERMTHPGVPDVLLHELLQELFTFLNTISSEPSSERARLLIAACTLRLLDVLGYALPLETCFFCQTPLQDPVWFVPLAGGFVCASCVRERRPEVVQATTVPPFVTRLLRFIRQSDLCTVARLTISTELLRAACVIVDRWVDQHAPSSHARARVYDPALLLV